MEEALDSTPENQLLAPSKSTGLSGLGFDAKILDSKQNPPLFQPAPSLPAMVGDASFAADRRKVSLAKLGSVISFWQTIEDATI